jgi:hypothetical protein
MHPGRSLIALATLSTILAYAACDGPQPTQVPQLPEHEPSMSMHHTNASPEVRRKIAELREWSASFHTLEGAAAAGYTQNIGCIDETLNGVDPSVARGMGYHLTRGDVDLIGDGVVDIDNPEFLVFAPHRLDDRLPKAERLGKARLVGFDYFVPASLWQQADPPEFFGVPFHWSEAFQGWMRHIYLWGNNPEGMFEDFNQATRLCTELLSP